MLKRHLFGFGNKSKTRPDRHRLRLVSCFFLIPH